MNASGVRNKHVSNHSSVAPEWKIKIETAYSFSNDHCTALIADPNLMRHPGANVDAVSNAICLLLGILFFRMRDCQLSFGDQMCCQASVGVWTVVGVPVAKLLARDGVLLLGCFRRVTYGPSVQVKT